MIKYNVTGDKRKRLVKKLSALTGYRAEYQGMPSMAFKVGDYVVSKNGTVEGDLPEDIIKALARSGFKGEVIEEASADPVPAGFTVSFPMDELTDSAVDNFFNMIVSKGSLIKMAFKLSSLPVEYGDEALTINWFAEKKLPLQTADYLKTFISAMVDCAKRQKYVIPRPMTTDNPKYNFRVFLNNIGLSGSEYKPLRKELLKNLKGCARDRHPGAKTGAKTLSV